MAGDRAAPIGITFLGSGSRGNAIVVHRGSEGLLIDAGFSGRELRRRLAAAAIDPKVLRGIVVSHEHTDHVSGLQAVSRQLQLPVYSNRRTAEVLRARSNLSCQVHVFGAGTAFDVGPFTIDPFSIPHDASDPMGFVIRCGERRIGIATDLGHASQLVCYQLRECDFLAVESNHDIGMLHDCKRPWVVKQRILGRHGHLSNVACMELLERILHARTRHVVLAHASGECNRYELVARCAQECLANLGRADIIPQVAVQDQVLPTIWI